MAFTFNPFTGNFDDVNVAEPVYSVQSVSVNTSAAANTAYLVDVSGGAVTITLPAPAANAYVVVKDSEGASETNTLTVAPNGAEEIEGVAGNFLIQSDHRSVTFVSDGTNWFAV